MLPYTDITHKFYGNFRVITHDLGISQWIIKGFIWEQHLLNLICSYIKPNTTIIDIGANIGTHTVGIIKSLKLHYNNDNTRVVAFEPQPFIYSILNTNINNINNKNPIKCESHDCGLSDSTMDVYMNMPDYLKVENPGGYGIDFNTIKDDTKTRVSIKTLDSFGYTNVSFIKIDVEGHENQVLKGAINTINTSRPVMIIEILGGVLPENASVSQLKYINDTIDHIKGFNYTVTNIQACDYLCIPNN